MTLEALDEQHPPARDVLLVIVDDAPQTRELFTSEYASSNARAVSRMFGNVSTNLAALAKAAADIGGSIGWFGKSHLDPTIIRLLPRRRVPNRINGRLTPRRKRKPARSSTERKV